MTKLTDIYPNRFIEPGELENRDITLTIKSFSKPGEEKAEDGSTIDKIVLWFEKTDKGLVLNRTNAKVIRHNLQSNDMDKWIGKQITIFPTQTSIPLKSAEKWGCIIEGVTGKMAMVPAIRIRAAKFQSGAKLS